MTEVFLKRLSSSSSQAQRGISTVLLVAVVAVVALAAAGITALLMNIFERKQEAAGASRTLVEVTADTTDPAKWGVNWPKQYDSYMLTATPTRTRFGGHGGSEALPDQKIERDPWLKRMFLGYAFSIDYRDRRGHAYMLADQENTERLSKPQTGSCLHCHATVMPLYRELGGGDAMKGFEASYKMSYKEINQKLHDMGHGHAVSCGDCHDPKTMKLIVTRPGFINGIRALATSNAATPFAPSIERWRSGDKARAYDPNQDATRTEKRIYRAFGDDGKDSLITINARTAAGDIVNDVTNGRYSIVVDESPLSASFISAGLEDMLDLIEKGVLTLTPTVKNAVIDASSIPHKEAIKRENTQSAQSAPDPAIEVATIGAQSRVEVAKIDSATQLTIHGVDVEQAGAEADQAQANIEADRMQPQEQAA